MSPENNQQLKLIFHQITDYQFSLEEDWKLCKTQRKTTMTESFYI